MRDSKTIKLTPLTVFVGSNGTGKSSIVEALEMYRTIVAHSLDDAIEPLGGYEKIHNQRAPQKIRRLEESEREYLSNPIAFTFLAGRFLSTRYSPALLRWNMSVASGPGGDNVFILGEEVLSTRRKDGHRNYEARIPGRKTFKRLPNDKWSDGKASGTRDDRSILNYSPMESDFYFLLGRYIASWEFLMLDPESMGRPRPQRRSQQDEPLRRSGSNLAQHLWRIRNKDLAVFENLIETVQHILPYMEDIQPRITREIERTVSLQMLEADFLVPGWLMSSGTLRLLAILALLRDPPPLLVIEEIENGLDPRSLNLVIQEVRAAIDAGKTQVIATTHSPYLLNMLDLDEIIMTERDAKTQEPVFTRLADNPDTERWSENFAPGDLYTMGRFRRGQS